MAGFLVILLFAGYLFWALVLQETPEEGERRRRKELLERVGLGDGQFWAEALRRQEEKKRLERDAEVEEFRQWKNDKKP